MATIRKEVTVDVPAAQVWDALRDVGNVHKRVARGFVTDCRMDGDARIVTFVNGAVVREPIVTIGDQDRRLVWSAAGAGTTHYNSSAQVFPEGEHRSRIVWTSDLLPNEMAATIGGMMELGMAAIKKTFDG